MQLLVTAVPAAGRSSVDSRGVCTADTGRVRRWPCFRVRERAAHKHAYGSSNGVNRAGSSRRGRRQGGVPESGLRLNIRCMGEGQQTLVRYLLCGPIDECH
jgi:hypothetical protein